MPRVQIMAIAAATLLLGAVVHWTGDSVDARLEPFLLELTTSAPLAGAWMLMALAIGTPLQRWVAPTTLSPLAMRLGLGIVASLALVTLIGTIGWPGGRTGAIVLLAGGALAGAIVIVRTIGERPRDGTPFAGMGGPRLGLLVAAAALVALVVAAASPPGWLWSTEFHGYDALSYHLQAPREWMAIGRIVPLEHCVYAAMPNAMEAAYLHLMLVRGDALEAAVACQFLHAALAVSTALICGAATRMWAGRAGLDERAAQGASTVATALVLATPWTIVVGSLAYSEMAVTAAFATGLLVLGDLSGGRAGSRAANHEEGRRGDDAPFRVGAMVGLCAAVACCAKLSAVGMVAVPLALVTLLVIPPRRWLAAGLAGTIVALLVFSPWLLRNWFVCGSPTFPFLTGVFGSGWWGAEQVAIWTSAHTGQETSLGGGLVRLWQQWFAFGFGPPPQAGEPWRTQWALLPWLGAIAVAAMAIRRPRGTLVMVAATVGVPVIFWLLATHMQSRFLVPTVVPLAMAVGIAAGQVRPRVWRGAIVTAVALLAFWPLAILRGERGGAPAAAIGAAALFTGDLHQLDWPDAQRSRAARRAFVDAAPPTFWINHLLGAHAHVLFVGHATPWYFGQGSATARATFRWHTVWDRGPLSRVVAEIPIGLGVDIAEAWRTALRNDGFTHVMIDLAMLDRWRESGWLDANLEPGVINALIGDDRRVIAASPLGIVLVDLGEVRSTSNDIAR